MLATTPTPTPRPPTPTPTPHTLVPHHAGPLPLPPPLPRTTRAPNSCSSRGMNTSMCSMPRKPHLQGQATGQAGAGQGFMR